MTKVLLAVDGANLMMRGFHGARLWDPANRYRPGSTAPRWPDELPGIVRSMLQGIMRRTPGLTHMVMALDHPGPTFRHDLHPEYKGHRQHNGPSPEELAYVLKPWLLAWGVAVQEAPGFEADDVLATLARRCVAAGTSLDILSRDEDLLQCVQTGVNVLWPTPREPEAVFGVWQVVQRTGVRPAQIPDWKAMSGCSSDNIPKIGETTETRGGRPRTVGFTPARAADVLLEYKNLEGVYEAVDYDAHLFTDREVRWLDRCRAQAFRMRQVTTLRADVPITLDPHATSISLINWKNEP
jgi:DNA polymerase-1